jgi:bifunctional enzyme CysN/CysC
MSMEKEYLLKIGTTRVACRLENVHSIQDAASLARDEAKQINRYRVADCDLQLARAISFDCAEEILTTGRFVIVDDYEICGGGIIREALEDRQTWVREKVLLRDNKWERSAISAEERAAKFGQKPALIIISGEKDSGKKPLAKALEASLLADGYVAYFIGIGNVLYGVDADIKGATDTREEHMRRLAEVAHILLDAGFILIVTAIGLRSEDLEIIRTAVQPDDIVTIWVGDAQATDVQFEMRVSVPTAFSVNIATVRALLENKGIIRPLR